jgi:hypothetical protein
MDKELWNKFLTNEIAINCKTEEEANVLFTYLKDLDTKWKDGEKLYKTEWQDCKDETCYFYEDNLLMYGNFVDCDDENKKIVTFARVLKGEKDYRLSCFSNSELLLELRERFQENGLKILIYK